MVLETKNWILIIGALLMALAVGLGAFGAHGLKNTLNTQQLEWWHTASNYLFISTLGMLIIGTVFQFTHQVCLKHVAIIMLIGISLFCGSIFALALGGSRKLGIITPIGGLLLLISWIYAAWCFYRLPN